MSNEINTNALISQLRAMANQAGVADKHVEKAADPKTEFTQILQQSLEGVNKQQKAATAMATAFEAGDPNIDVSKVMIEMQKARISFETLSQVRNKFVEAYKDIMNMPL